MATSVIDDAWTFGSDDEVLYRLIKGEVPEQTMPTVYSVLTDDEVWQILAFIRSVYAGDPARDRLVGRSPARRPGLVAGECRCQSSV